MMEIDKSTQGTLEEQMFYRRTTLQELTGLRHDNPKEQVMHHKSFKILLDKPPRPIKHLRIFEC
jgi:hypothetical protein